MKLPLLSIVCALLCVLPSLLVAESAAAKAPTDLPGLLCFWDFQEPAGSIRIAKGPHPYRLREMSGPIERVEDGVFGPYAARIRPGQWLSIPRADCPALDLHGKEAQVTVVAWIKRESKSFWQAIGGVWDETRKKRQYFLFVNARARTDFRTMTRIPSQDNVHGHISATGGTSPGENVWLSYASGETAIPLGQWQMIAMTYDGKEISVYVNGTLDRSEGFNPLPYSEGIFDGQADGADFTVGSNSVRGKPANFFGGLIGGLAVYERAMTEHEIASLRRAP